MDRSSRLNVLFLESRNSGTKVFYPSCDLATAEAVPWNYLYSRSYWLKFTANENARIVIISSFVNYDYWLFWETGTG